jgi:hypothetical protein
VIISGLSDPTQVISSSNVTVTGGIVALGKDGSASPSSAGSPGLRIVPDYALLTGEKIPPVTPNILDVRIVRHEVTAAFPVTESTAEQLKGRRNTREKAQKTLNKETAPIDVYPSLRGGLNSIETILSRTINLATAPRLYTVT